MTSRSVYDGVALSCIFLLCHSSRKAWSCCVGLLQPSVDVVGAGKGVQVSTVGRRPKLLSRQRFWELRRGKLKFTMKGMAQIHGRHEDESSTPAGIFQHEE